MIEKYDEIPKLIDLTKSYVFFDFETSFRTNIDSILINENENKTYYLVKECRSEAHNKLDAQTYNKLFNYRNSLDNIFNEL